MLFDILGFLLLCLNVMLGIFITDSNIRELIFIEKNKKKRAITFILIILLLDCIFINNHLI